MPSCSLVEELVRALVQHQLDQAAHLAALGEVHLHVVERRAPLHRAVLPRHHLDVVRVVCLELRPVLGLLGEDEHLVLLLRLEDRQEALPVRAPALDQELQQIARLEDARQGQVAANTPVIGLDDPGAIPRLRALLRRRLLQPLAAERHEALRELRRVGPRHPAPAIDALLAEDAARRGVPGIQVDRVTGDALRVLALPGPSKLHGDVRKPLRGLLAVLVEALVERRALLVRELLRVAVEARVREAVLRVRVVLVEAGRGVPAALGEREVALGFRRVGELRQLSALP
jgi:hypothetical protein